MEDYGQRTQASYDRVAAEYTKRIADELDYKPLERELLVRFAVTVNGKICDLGCGPGHVARYLHDHGADVIGIDLSPAMIEQARSRNSDIRFEQGDMRALKFEDNSLGGIAALYSIIHIPRAEVTTVLTELKRVLKPGGALLAGFHQGQETLHQQELWGEAVNLDFSFFEPDEMRGYLETAGFEIAD